MAHRSGTSLIITDDTKPSDTRLDIAPITKDSSPIDDSYDAQTTNVGTFKQRRDEIRADLHELRQYCYTPIEDLPNEKLDKFNSLVSSFKLMYGTPGTYNSIINDVREIYGDLQEIRPGTVGSYFMGCFKGNSGQGCTPHCANSLQPLRGTPGYHPCDELVLIYKDSRFKQLNTKRSSRAIIYVEDQHFKGFTKENIDQLRALHVYEAKLLDGNPDGTIKRESKYMPISKLPMQETKKQQSNLAMLALVGIVFFVILILLILLAYRSGMFY